MLDFDEGLRLVEKGHDCVLFLQCHVEIACDVPDRDDEDVSAAELEIVTTDIGIVVAENDVLLLAKGARLFC
jgi:hypothetical protein